MSGGADPVAKVHGIVQGVKMGRTSIRLPDSLHEEVRKLAKRENISINRLATLAVAEKVAAIETADYFMRRTSRADKKKFLRAISKVADEEPDNRDPP
jgi:predicted transcriptional regulator